MRATAARHVFYFVVMYMLFMMNLENVILSEISQSQKDKYHMITLI